MIVTHKIGLDLVRRGTTPRLNAVQGDVNTRVIEASLYSGGTAWTVPEGVEVSLRYCKPDGTKGIYDTLPDGTQAWSASGNTVTITMAPQMLAAAGLVLAQVVLVLDSEVLATFTFQIHVAPNPAAGTMGSEDYVNWLQKMQRDMIDTALAQAKQSGEFDGEPGHPLLLLNGKDAENDADEYILAMLSTGLIKKYTIKNLEETDSVAVGDSVCVSVRNTTKNATAMIYGTVLEISGTDIAIKPCGVLDSGYTPHIGDNGNWFIGTEDTGVAAKGQNGENGFSTYCVDVETGDAATITVYNSQISNYERAVQKGDFFLTQDGNLFVVDSELLLNNAEGSSVVGYSANFLASLKGNRGEDGLTPHIGDNGNWFVGTEDTGVKAQGDAFTYEDFTAAQLEALRGPKGNAGISGASLYYTTEDNTDDGETIFEIANIKAAGRELAAGDLLLTPGGRLYSVFGVATSFVDAEFICEYLGSNGLTPRIGDNGNWFIGTEDTGVQAKGTNGSTPSIGSNGNWYIGETDTGVAAKGKDGENGYSLYVTTEDTDLTDYPFDPEPIQTSGRTLMAGDLLLTPSGKLFRVYGVSSGIIDAEYFASFRGNPGSDGVSPTVDISKSGKTTTITITDKDGVKTETVNDGSDAAVTADNIKTALGYTPADEETVNGLKSDLAELNSTLGTDGGINIFNCEDVTYGYLRSFNVGHQITQYTASETFAYSNQIWPCKKGDIIRSNKAWFTQILIYDANDVCVYCCNYDGNPVEVTDDTAVKFAINVYQSQLKSTMITLNQEIPASYTPYEKNIVDRVSDIESQFAAKYFDKAFVVLSFDAFNLIDSRFQIVNDEFGYKATVAYTTDSATNKTVLNAGWDIGLYMLNNYPPDAYGQDDAVSTTPTEEVLNAWDAYVKSAVDEAEGVGVFNPVVWQARKGCSCLGLETALKKYGIPMCRGSYNPDYSNDWEYSPNDLPTMTVAVKETLMPSTLEACQADIVEAVASKTGVAFLTHGIYATDDEANNSYGITEATLRSFLNTVKQYVDAGTLEVVTYRDIFAKYYKKDANEYDYNRIIKMVNKLS